MSAQVHELRSIMDRMVDPGKGILAADESDKTIAKRFAEIGLESTEENRRAYRELLFTTPGINEFILGVILYEETLYQKTKSGKPFPELLQENNIIPGIKVDKGLVPLPRTENENITEGLDGLSQRLTKYKKMGALFAKWRGVFTITDQTPSELSIAANAEALARYAAICQSLNIVPIVEPEVLIDGNHSIDRCAEVSEKVLHEVFSALVRHRVVLEYIILKPSMVLPGKEHMPTSIVDVALMTLRVLRRTVPAAVRTINFLSGGQSDKDATAHLNTINSYGIQPWNLSFSFARALQEPCLKTWKGKAENVAEAQRIFHARARLNSLASRGKYEETMDVNASVG